MPRPFLASFALAPLALAQHGGERKPPFVDATTESGIAWRNVCGSPKKEFILEANGNGAALADFDGDGDLDLLLTQGTTLDAWNRGEGATCSLYRNLGGGRFEDASADFGLVQRGWWTGVATADFDGDGDVDALITAYGPDALLRNDGGRFADCGSRAGVDDPAWSTSAAWFDLDSDGALDLYTANYLEFDAKNPPKGAIEGIPCRWKGKRVFCGPHGMKPTADRVYRNRGDGTFEDVSDSCGARRAPASYGLGVVAADLDLDGDDEVYVANDSVPNFLFRNDGGRLVEIGFEAGVATSETGASQAGMGTAAGDFDGDGRFDLVVGNFSDEPTTLYRNAGALQFDNATYTTGLGAPTLAHLKWGLEFLDFDLDGDLDLFTGNGHVYPEADDPETGTSYRQRSQLFENAETPKGRRFVERTADALVSASGARGVAFGDVDDDGDTDVVTVPMDDGAKLLRAESGRSPRIVLELVGTRSSRDALGAVVRVRAGGRTLTREVRRNSSFQSSNDPRPVFGLGAAREAEGIEVRWPSGRVDALGSVKAGTRVRIVEGTGVVAQASLAPTEGGR